MSNVNSMNYKSRLDNILKNCRQSNRQHSSDKSPKNQSSAKNRFNTSFSTKNNATKTLLFPNEIRINTEPQNDIQNRQNRAISALVPSQQKTKAHKLCELLDQLIKDADCGRKALQTSANLNMPLQQKKMMQPMFVLKENIRPQSFHQCQSTNTFSYSVEEDLEFDVKPQTTQNKTNTDDLRRQIARLQAELKQKDIQLLKYKEENTHIKKAADNINREKECIERELQTAIEQNSHLKDQLRNQREKFMSQISEMENEKNNMEEVLKNYLLKRELNKLRIFGSGVEDISAQSQSISIDQNRANEALNLTSNDLMQYVESKNISKAQLLLPNESELQRIKDSQRFAVDL